MKHIILGGVAAGMSAASKIRRLDKDAVIHVYEKGAYLSYGACGLSYYVAGYNDDPTKMIARSREQFEKSGIKTFLYHEAVAVDTALKTVTINDTRTGRQFTDSYDRLMIATGAEAVRPPLPGMDKKGVFTLKTMDDGLVLKEQVQKYGIQSVVVIGGGYIGVEVLEAMHAQGKDVTCIEAAPRILTTFDDEIAQLAKAELVRNKITLRENEKVHEIKGGISVSSVVTDRGEYPADLVVVAAGIRPNTKFLQGTGVELAQNGAVVTDRHMQTTVPGIYSAGDCALVYDFVKNSNVYLPLGTTANKCGRIAGENMCGGNAEYVGAASSSALKVCGLELGRTGMGQAEAEAKGLNVGTVFVEASNHPHYYPGQKALYIKVIYERPSLRILGAQLCGEEGAALRTDIFAVALHAGMTTKQLGQTDLIYSPPYAGVWDAVHIACNAAK